MSGGPVKVHGPAEAGARSAAKAAPEPRIEPALLAAGHRAARVPGGMSVAEILRLQRTVGNRAVQRLLRPAPTTAPRGDRTADLVHLAASAGVATPSQAMPFGARIQASFGHHDVSDVRAHVGPEAASTAAAMDATAYAAGDHVVFGAPPDLATAAHEAAHVVHQRLGAEVPDGVGRAGDRWEQHADRVAGEVVAGRSAEAMLDGAATSAPARATVQRSWGRSIGGGILGALGGLLAMAASPLIGLVGGAIAGYRKAAGPGGNVGLGILGAIGGGIAGAIAAPVAAALSPVAGLVYGGIMGGKYMEGRGAASQIGGGIAGALGGALLPLTAGAVVGASLMERAKPEPASAAVHARVTALAQQYGITIQPPRHDAAPWLEDELLGLEQALTVYEVILSGGATSRRLAMTAALGQHPFDLQAKPINKIPHDQHWTNATNAFASPAAGVTVCGDSILRRLGGAVFTPDVHKGILVHEMAHALLGHEVQRFHTGIDAWLAQQPGHRRNFWQINVDRGGDPNGRIKREGGDIEYPITTYGGSTPEEDLCETIRFYFQSPATKALLRARAPARFHVMDAIVQENMTRLAPGAIPAGPIGFTDPRGRRQQQEVSAAEVARLGAQIQARQDEIATLEGRLRDPRTSGGEMDRVQEELPPLRRRLQEMRDRHGRIDQLVRGVAPATQVENVQQFNAINGRGPPGLVSGQLTNSLPA
ncbi:MAG TPA: DUF4157 domain-containing protein [Miltoncostaea sp.]|nr:DUF4157 domain-containing protein [Miltoncostaea sp.]